VLLVCVSAACNFLRLLLGIFRSLKKQIRSLENTSQRPLTGKRGEILLDIANKG